MNNKTKMFVRAALFAALAAVATMVIAIPLPGGGYANLGDAVVLLAAFFLPVPYAAVAAGLGTAMADVLLSYTLYAPATFVIKALMALCAGALARGKTCFQHIRLPAQLLFAHGTVGVGQCQHLIAQRLNTLEFAFAVIAE